MQRACSRTRCRTSPPSSCRSGLPAFGMSPAAIWYRHRRKSTYCPSCSPFTAAHSWTSSAHAGSWSSARSQCGCRAAFSADILGSHHLRVADAERFRLDHRLSRCTDRLCADTSGFAQIRRTLCFLHAHGRLMGPPLAGIVFDNVGLWGSFIFLSSWAIAMAIAAWLMPQP